MRLRRAFSNARRASGRTGGIALKQIANIRRLRVLSARGYEKGVRAGSEDSLFCAVFSQKQGIYAAGNCISVVP